ncbi:MAG: heme-degrading domain-containing protein [Meiothermus sp.]|uniref:heme-degrading domain-containing protein n=1 Tax=Meiothermus sp. TaxID=1955249 RepID=UPI0025CEE163|nr:heme-degrading domain-containing protein [Meiothermus sp.]MCS7067746.1 heme-degrading domain-containing protein [Meiothermus sp.]MDW8424521.1 heme-degrading domain-containing protein [Meiothermus sp.]
MNLEQDLAGIAEQEARLRFEHFDAEVAWELGQKLRQAADALHSAIAMDIGLFGQPLFFYAMRGTSPDNADWVRRKRNVVQRFHRSSYAVGLMLKQKQSSLEERGLDARDYAAHGGGFPIFVKGVGCIGAVTVSGLPQREDHELVVEVLADYLGVPYEELALDP